MKILRVALVLMLAAVLQWAVGCGGGGGEASPLEQGMRNTLEGSYQVKGIEDGITRGVGIYDNGSFRIVVEDAPRMVIYNAETGEGWLVNLNMRTYQPITRDEALLKAGFMPEQLMQPYFGMENLWNGAEFRMDTEDGRSIRAFLEGPGYLPSAWRAEQDGEVFKEMLWEYLRVGQISPDNFRLPEGLAPQT